MLAGEILGKYQVKHLLGAGGMGEVYLAHDESLDRHVAVKVLLPEFFSDLERVNRFKLEARATSALNHPNIITIYETGQHEERLFIATEFISGETLRGLLERRAINFDSALQIAEQILSGLTAAHQAGIVHRDLKPENIMVREDGIVKILDFGLAKPTLVESEAETREFVNTKAGMVLGSVSYMSPEQSRGKETDARTDLWSVGVVFYEMLAAVTPFAGETLTDVLANIIYKEPPPISEYAADAPPELQRILKKSLRKDREERYQSAKDLLLDLKNLRRELEIEHEVSVSVSPNRTAAFRSSGKIRVTGNTDLKPTNAIAETQILSDGFSGENDRRNLVSPVRFKKKRLFALTALAVLLLGILGLARVYFWHKPTLVDAYNRNAVISTIADIENAGTIVISPDGKYLAYVKLGTAGDSKLILRQIETGSEKDVSPVNQNIIGLLRFAPDANYLYFTMQPKGALGYILYRVPTLGGELKQIAFDVDSGVSFYPDGKSLIFHRHIINPSTDKIIEIKADGGEEKEIYSSENLIVNPQISPDGKTIALLTDDKAVPLGKPPTFLATMPISGGDFVRLGSNWGYATDFSWLKDGSGLVVSGFYENAEDSKIYLIKYPSGEVSQITKDANFYQGASLTADGKTVATIQTGAVTGIWQYDTITGKAEQISRNDKEKIGTEGIALAPNGDIIYAKSISKDEGEIWSMNSQTKVSKMLTAKDSGRSSSPFVSADGKYIFYQSFRSGGLDIWRMDADGANTIQITKTPEILENIGSVSADGKSIVYTERGRENEIPVIKQTNVETGETTTILRDEKQYPDGGRLSPDGGKLLYINAPINFGNGVIPQSALYIAPFDGKNLGESRQILKTLNGNQYKWSADGKTILYTDSSGGNADLWQLDPANGKTSKITNFNLESILRYAFSPDGKKIILVRLSRTQDIILIKTATK